MTSSPLRYPGGKGRMYKQILAIMQEYNLFHHIYTEPFAGGFGLGIKLLTDSKVEKAIINDADPHIYEFWKNVFYNSESLIKLIENIEVNIENWKIQKEIYENIEKASSLEIAFSAFYLNRTNYSGVLKGGPLGGMEQKSLYKIDCRMNKERLIKKIQEISTYREKVEIYNKDVSDFIKKIIIPRKEVLFVNFDPPYVIKGYSLYQNYYKEKDHIALSEIILAQLHNLSWIMTYDDCDLIKGLYSQYSPEEFTLNHFAGRKKIGRELLIKNL